MATLYDYINGLTVGGNAVVWTDDLASQADVDSTDGSPYVVVEEQEDSVFARMYGRSNVMARRITVRIFQGQQSDGSVPDKTLMHEIFYKVLDAVEAVDEHTFNQPIVTGGLQMAGSLPPKFDRESNGLFAAVEFRLLLPRGA